MTPDVLLAARGVSRRYGTRIAVQGLNLELRRGEVLGLLGLNGAGKSTTLQILTGVLAPHSGVVKIGGHDLARSPLAAKRHVGYLPEIPPLYQDSQVDEYLRFCAELHAVPPVQVENAVARCVNRCGLTEVSHRLIRNLSKGYQQRVGIAQAIVHEPSVLILDEPTVGLDPAQIQEVRALIRTLGREHAVVLSTHLLAEADSLCSRVVILHHGRVVYDHVLGEGGRSLMVGFSAPPALKELSQLLNVRSVSMLAGGRFECLTDDLAATAEVITVAAVNRHWGLQELTPGKTTLERTFLELTRDHQGLGEHQ
ncbi:MAG: ATP-binding cassette domain-containing protein [Gammaproteobacteria bacterium]|nr:ATP-binding cassette domain-containing protein [Gammaproteobacteria bacterium]